jgi:hypothetical protein
MTAVAMAGRRFDEFLTPESAQKLRGLAADLVSGAQAYLWVAGGLEGVELEGGQVPG